MTLRAVLVDDEEPALELLREMLRAWPEVEIIGEASNGEAAAAMIANRRPDLVFLDVQMPRMNGFEVIAALPPDGGPAPLIVFVTAYDEYAIRAFEVSACDYLLKPFDEARLARTMTRVLARSSSGSRELGSRELETVMRSYLARSQVVVKVNGRHLFLAADELEWVESAGKELKLHVGKQVLVTRESMNDLERRLDPDRFIRVHRSFLINRSQVREMQPWFRGEYVLILKNGTKIVTGRTYHEAVRRLVDG